MVSESRATGLPIWHLITGAAATLARNPIPLAISAVSWAGICALWAVAAMSIGTALQVPAQSMPDTGTILLVGGTLFLVLALGIGALFVLWGRIVLLGSRGTTSGWAARNLVTAGRMAGVIVGLAVCAMVILYPARLFGITHGGGPWIVPGYLVPLQLSNPLIMMPVWLAVAFAGCLLFAWCSKTLVNGALGEDGLRKTGRIQDNRGILPLAVAFLLAAILLTLPTIAFDQVFGRDIPGMIVLLLYQGVQISFLSAMHALAFRFRATPIPAESYAS